jgi:hypothetical protein
MGKLSLWAGMLILIFVSTISPTSLNGRFVVLNSDSSKLAVLLQISTNTGTDDLGGATIVIGFNKQVLGFNSNPLNQTDYLFHNFSGDNYNEARVTKPLSDKLWINIDLPPVNNDKGTIVSGPEKWTDVVTLYFTITSLDDSVGLNYLEENGFWGVYDADNQTRWANGELNNLLVLPEKELTNVEADNNVPTEFELAQNYPNPFNPSTKIKYTIPASLNPSEGGKLVQLKVYDILGNEVATLVNELQQVGQHEVVFDAAGLASGIYIYRIQTAAYINTRKMILLR